MDLSIAIWDSDRPRGLSLKEQLDMFSEREATLYHGEVSAYHDVFFLSADNRGEPLKVAVSIRSAGDAVHLLIVCDRNRDVTTFLRPSIRPSGVLFRPVQNREIRGLLEEIVAEFQRQTGDDSMFMFKSEGVSYRVHLRDILFFEADNKKVNIHTTGQQVGYYDSIENLAARLPENFIRCHRGFVVNVSKVEELRGTEMELRISGGYRIPLSRSRKGAIIKALAEGA